MSSDGALAAAPRGLFLLSFFKWKILDPCALHRVFKPVTERQTLKINGQPITGTLRRAPEGVVASTPWSAWAGTWFSPESLSVEGRA